LGRFSLAKGVRAHLIERGVRPLGFNVDVPTKGVVHVTGIIHDADEEQRIEQNAKTVPGVEQVHVQVTLVHAGYVS
jgi:osmotically-inducible protein OsmY